MVSAARQAAAVQWQVGPQAAGALQVAAWPVMAAFFVVLWLLVGAGQGESLVWRVGTGFVVWGLSAGAWVLWLRQRRAGALVWTGVQWEWHCAQAGAEGVHLMSPAVAWDGQQAMLLKLEGLHTDVPLRWLWVSARQPQAQGMQALRWGDLRRAVYSPATVRDPAAAL